MTKPKNEQKPSKPTPDFPLSAHACGQWCKRINGKLRFFGPWRDPKGALQEYQRQRDALAGGTSEREGKLTVRRLCNKFLHSKRHLVDQGDLSEKTWNDYEAASKRLIKFLGPARSVQSLKAMDFERYRRSFPKEWGAVRTNNEIIRISAIINYAFRNGDVDKPIALGVVFRRVPVKRVRQERAAKPEKFFTASEIHRLLDHAGDQMRAMILLGINCGYGNADCGRLTRDMLDLQGGWLSEPRHKTGVWRSSKLWPETIESLNVVLEKRHKFMPEEVADLVFVTRHKRPWWVEGNSWDAISKEFTKIRKAARLFRRGVGFYSLRHVTQTIGEQTPDLRDPIAIKVVMGHADNSISAQYREDYDREPIEAISDYLRSWFLAGKARNESPYILSFETKLKKA